MNFLIIHNGGCRNKGCQALTYTIIDNIEKRFPKSHYTIYTDTPEYDKTIDMPSKNITFVQPSYFIKLGRKAYLSLYIKYFFGISINVFLEKELKEFIDCDVIISSGGDTMCGTYKGAPKYARFLKYAKLLRKNVCILASTLGPYKDKKLKRDILKILKLVDLITVRDKITKAYLDDNNIKDNVYLTADPAFLLPTKKIQNGLFDNDNKIIGLGLSEGIANYNNIPYEKVYEFYLSLINKLLKKSYNVVLIAHVVDDTVSNNDDHALGLRLQKEIGNDKIYLHEKDISAIEIKGLIQKCNLFMGPRMHSTIASFSNYIPTISMAYSEKAFGINELIFGHTDYVFDVSTLDTNKLLNLVDNTMKNELSVVNSLKEIIPKIKELSKKNFEILDNYFNKV